MSTIIKHKEFTNRHVYKTEVAGRPLTMEVGKLAELANAAVMVGYGDTRVLCCVTAAPLVADGATLASGTVSVRVVDCGASAFMHAVSERHIAAAIRKQAIFLKCFIASQPPCTLYFRHGRLEICIPVSRSRDKSSIRR